MAAAIVYDNVGGGGDLFTGLKFYILQRVPFRNTWKNLIQTNGGELVLLEKQADMIIADHARKDAPPGSISWTYIDKSVRNGKLEDIEDHRAGPAERVVREAGSGQPSRKGRTPFTVEDDRILMEWCAQAEARGASLKGNELYIQLEAKNPRHTFQSWRDRWVKYLSERPRPSLHGDEAQEVDESTNRNPPLPTRKLPVPQLATQRAESASTRTTLTPSAATPVVRPRSSDTEATPQRPFVATSAGGTNFTEDEIQLLLDSYDDILNLDEDHIIDAWIAWALQNPNHTAQEWRNYFNKEIKAKEEARQQSIRDSSPERHFIAPPAVPSPAIVPKAKQEASSSKQAQQQAREVKDSQESSGQTLQSPDMGKKVVDPALTNEKLFKADLTTLAESLELEVDFVPVICGKKVPLFELWQVVRSNDFGGFDAVNGRKLWPQVARRFNFNDYRHASAASDLKSCYSEILADFEVARERYQELNPEMTLTESQEEAMIESQLRQTAARDSQFFDDGERLSVADDDDEHDDDLDYPQSSSAIIPPSSSSKRSFGADRTNISSSFNKRQRVDKGKGAEIEIPSTPEDEISYNQSRPFTETSPLRQVPLEPGDDSESEELFVRPNKPSHLKPMLNAQNLEPETQDFHFPPEPEGDNHEFVENASSPLQAKLSVGAQSSISNTNAASGSMPSRNDSTQSQTDAQIAHDLQEYIEAHMALGYPQEIVFEALEATTMALENASFVMEALMGGGGIPEDMAGIWTTRDDAALHGEQGGETDEYRRIVLKHGKERIKSRKSYWRNLKEVREED